MKALLNPYNEMGNYIHNLGRYMFAVGCRSVNVNQCTKFIGIVATMGWKATPPHHRGHVSTELAVATSNT
jgi:hypothetical protein